MFAKRHMHEYGTTREQLLAGGRQEPLLRRQESQRAVPQGDHHGEGAGLGSGGLALPGLRLLRQRRRRGLRHPGQRGAGPGDRAGDKVVWLDGMGCATASMSVLRRPDLVGLPSAERSRRPGLRDGRGHAGRHQSGRGARLLHHRRDHGLRGPGLLREGRGWGLHRRPPDLHRRQGGGQRGRRSQGQGPSHRGHRRLHDL